MPYRPLNTNTKSALTVASINSIVSSISGNITKASHFGVLLSLAMLRQQRFVSKSSTELQQSIEKYQQNSTVTSNNKVAILSLLQITEW